MIARKADMPLTLLCRKLSYTSALFVNRHHGALFTYTGHGRVYYRSALVRYPIKGYVIFIEVIESENRSVSSRLFIMRGKKIYVDRELEVLKKQLLYCRKLSEQRCFCINCSSAPELAVLDYASERLLLPITCRFNYVMMRHNHYIPCLILTL